MIPNRLRLPASGLVMPGLVLALVFGLAPALPGVVPQAWAQSAPPPGSPASGLPAPAQAAAMPGSESGAGAGAGTGAAYANMAARMDNLQTEIDDLTGKIQVVDHQLQVLSDRIDKLSKDVNFRLNALEGHGPAPAAGANTGTSTGAAAGAPAGGMAATASPANPTATAPTGNAAGSPFREPPPHPLGSLPANAPLPTANQGAAATPATGAATGPGAAPAVTLPQGSPETQYKFATDFLRRGDYARAGQAFAEFVKAHPQHPLASNAQYWLGETYYVRQLYAQSAAAFLAGYRRDPKGDKAPADLLKLGMSLIGLKKPQEACAVFKQLAAQYPHAEPRIKQYAARERARAKCPGA